MYDPELPDPNAGDDVAYAEAWDDRIRDVDIDPEELPTRPRENGDEI